MRVWLASCGAPLSPSPGVDSLFLNKRQTEKKKIEAIIHPPEEPLEILQVLLLTSYKLPSSLSFVQLPSLNYLSTSVSFPESPILPK